MWVLLLKFVASLCIRLLLGVAAAFSGSFGDGLADLLDDLLGATDDCIDGG